MVEPNGGGEIFDTILKTSTEMFKLVSEASQNVVSMSTPITLMVDETECDLERLTELGIETKKMGIQYILEASCIVDTGADISCTTDEVSDALGRAPLTDADGGVKGVGGVLRDREKDKLRVIISDKKVTICESRKVGDLGINGNVNQSFNEAARIEIGSDKFDNRFEWNQKEVQSHILIGLKSGSLLCHQLTEQEMVDAELDIPIFSPELQVWRSPLSQKLMITCPVGVNHELIELHNNFPRFHLLHQEDQSEEEILARVRKQGTKY